MGRCWCGAGIENACYVLAAAQVGSTRPPALLGPGHDRGPWGEMLDQCGLGRGAWPRDSPGSARSRRKLDSTRHARLLPALGQGL